MDCRELALVKLIRNAQNTAVEKDEKRIPRTINFYTYIIRIIKKCPFLCGSHIPSENGDGSLNFWHNNFYLYIIIPLC